MTKINDLLKQREDGAELYILDVRSRNEYSDWHINGTYNLPFDEIESVTNVLPDRNARIYLFCRTGRYSSNAKTVLNYIGYDNVCDLGAVT